MSVELKITPPDSMSVKGKYQTDASGIIRYEPAFFAAVGSKTKAVHAGPRVTLTYQAADGSLKTVSATLAIMDGKTPKLELQDAREMTPEFMSGEEAADGQ